MSSDGIDEYDALVSKLVDDLGPPKYSYKRFDLGTKMGVIINWGKWSHATRYPRSERDPLLDILARERLVNWVMNKTALGFTPDNWDQHPAWRKKSE